MAAALIAVGWAALLPSAKADPRSDVLNTAAQCNVFTNYRQWLDCYYGAAQPMREILGLPPAPSAQVKLVPSAGAPAARVPAPVPVAARPAAGTDDYVPRQHLADYSFDTNNRFTVTMENGTVWQQLKEDSIAAKWRAPPQNYSATIVPALFGYMMRVSDGHSYRVKRVR
ncbi:MAG TPA: hypothetical protein VFI23_08885 [Rhizomicrobium sp.]|nr:hypothetical protein [Rhizomicrobium sp.]